MNYIKHLETIIEQTIKTIGYPVEFVTIVPSSKPEFGEYQYNGIMSLAKKNQENPIELAKKVKEQLEKNEYFEEITIAGPGFINIRLEKQNLMNYGNDLLKTKQYVEKLPPKKIIMDYGGPNIAKVLHVGHLRSGNIGEALKRLAKALGFDVISDIHLGDYGLQMGLIMLEIEERYPNLECFKPDFNKTTIENFPITNEDLIDLYPIASNKAKKDEEILEKARNITYLFQKNHPGYKALWRSIMEISLKDMKEIYDLLHVEFDLWNGESDVEKYIPEVIEYLKEKNMVEKSEGALVINVTEERDKLNIPPLLLVKSNQTVSYETTDIATLWDREKTYHPDEVWYVVDKRQEMHFTQVFRACYKSNIIKETTHLEFIGFGTMNGLDGKPFKTRDGKIMSLRELLNIVKIETEKNIIPSIIGEEREKIAEIISVGAIKFADLLSNRATDYIFDPEKFCDATGKTGPFILYSTIRMKSLLEKSCSNHPTLTELKGGSDKKVLTTLIHLPRVLENSLKSKTLNEIIDFIYSLNNNYNNFYSENRILTEENQNLKNSWIALTQLVYDINQYLLSILAIEIPNRM